MSWKRSTVHSITASHRTRYAFAVAAICVAVPITLLATRWLEDFPLLILITAVMASALRGGTGPGLLATALSGLAIFGATHFLARRFAIPPVNAGGEVVRLVIFLVVATGISLLAGARQRAEGERDLLLVREKTARAEAEAANGAKDRFLAAVSHELRTPLAAILSWASLLRGTAGCDETIRRALDAIERNAKSQARLVDDLLDVSRIVAGKLRLETRPTNLVPIIEAAVATLASAADAKHIRLHAAIDPDTGLVWGDPDRLLQVIWNLVSNAVKFTPEHGHISLHLTRVGPHAEVAVADTGPGIAAGLLQHVFEPFWQAKTGSGNQHTAGLGLGLAIVHQLVELHAGTVAVESRGAGQGTIFRVTIPLIEPKAQAGHIAPSDVAGAAESAVVRRVANVGPMVMVKG
jgi:signal transduction histidine kinase